MPNNEANSFFYDEWRDCLRSHYRYVVASNDYITEPTLRAVLLDAGVDEADVQSWYAETLQQQQALHDDAAISTNNVPEDDKDGTFLDNPTLFDM